MKSTVIQLRELRDSLAWQDIRLAALTRLSQARNELEIMPDQVDIYEDAMSTAFLRGRAFELRFLANLPDELVSQIERGDLKWQTEEQEEELGQEERQELDQLEKEQQDNQPK